MVVFENLDKHLTWPLISASARGLLKSGISEIDPNIELMKFKQRRKNSLFKVSYILYTLHIKQISFLT